MKYSAQEVLQYVREDDVKFIRLAFCDVFGRQKNIAIMPSELERAFDSGIAFDASAIAGFGGNVRSDLFIRPDPSTLTGLPWRSENGKVVRMFGSIVRPDGSTFECDTRALLSSAVERAAASGLSFRFGPEMEFYLFRLDENGEPTKVPYDRAGYMDVAPYDRGENLRREVCLSLEKMGIHPESSHHEEGPGQNEVDFRHSDALSAADNALTFRTIVETAAERYGLCADFSPKPLADEAGSGMHINLSVSRTDGTEPLESAAAGILYHAADMTAFLNPVACSYARLGSAKAPGYISWANENRSQLIRMPAAPDGRRRAELRSPDSAANPYIAFALLVHAGIDGIESGMTLPRSCDVNLFDAAPGELCGIERLPETLEQAHDIARASSFISRCLPEELIRAYVG